MVSTIPLLSCKRGGYHPGMLFRVHVSRKQYEHSVSRLLEMLYDKQSAFFVVAFPPSAEPGTNRTVILEGGNNSSPWDCEGGEIVPKTTDAMKEGMEGSPQECDWLEILSYDPYYRGLQDKVPAVLGRGR